MAAPLRIASTYRVRFDESGADGCLPASGFLRYAQDLAWVHSDGAGFGRRWYAERGLAWLVRAVELELDDRPVYGELLEVSTEVVGFRRVWARRRSEFTRGGAAQRLAAATIDWVLLDDSGQPTRVPREIVDTFETPPGSFSPLRVRLDEMPGTASGREFSVRRSELDPLAHVNNAAYLDYLDEQLARGPDSAVLARLPRAYLAEFVLPAEQDMALIGLAWRNDGGWSYRLESAAGQELVRAKIRS